MTYDEGLAERIRDLLAGEPGITEKKMFGGLAFLVDDPAIRSNTSVCLKFTDDRITDGAAFAKAVVKRLDAEGVAYDIGAYRDAPPGLRIWCGGTVEASDVAALMPWINWAYQAEIEALTEAA